MKKFLFCKLKLQNPKKSNEFDAKENEIIYWKVIKLVHLTVYETKRVK